MDSASKLREAGVTPEAAERFAELFAPDRIDQVITAERSRSTRTNPGGWIRNALVLQWNLPAVKPKQDRPQSFRVMSKEEERRLYAERQARQEQAAQEMKRVREQLRGQGVLL